MVWRGEADASAALRGMQTERKFRQWTEAAARARAAAPFRRAARARKAAQLARAHSLLLDLIARYGIDPAELAGEDRGDGD